MDDGTNRIRVMADDTAALVIRLKAEMDETADPQKRKALRLRMKTAKILENWYRTRVGYR